MDKLKTRGVLLAYNTVSCAEGLVLNKGIHLLTVNMGQEPCMGHMHMIEFKLNFRASHTHG